MTDFTKLPGFIQEMTPVRVYEQYSNATPIVIATAVGSANIPIIRLLGVSFRVRTATTLDLNNIQMKAGYNQNQTLINDQTGQQGNLNEQSKQVHWDGGQAGLELGNGETVTFIIDGSTATYLDGDVSIRFSIIDPGATLG